MASQDMIDIEPKYKCPECNRAIVNRRVAYCLYCSATLPAAAMLAPAQIVALDDMQPKLREKSTTSPAQEESASASAGGELIDSLLDIVTDIGDLF